jgi:hypothetical protein
LRCPFRDIASFKFCAQFFQARWPRVALFTSECVTRPSFQSLYFHPTVRMVAPKPPPFSKLLVVAAIAVEREAWENYSNRYPSERTAVLMACPYNPTLLLAEWVSKITLLFRFKKDINARGSKSPHVNIDLYSMRSLADFISQEFDTTVDQEYYKLMVEYVKEWPISNPGRPWLQYNACVRELQISCPWLRQRNATGFLEPANAGGTLSF